MASPSLFRTLRSWLVLAALAVLAFWLLFFDDYSVVKRVMWMQERNALAQENAALQQQLDTLELRLREGISDALVEEIAREQYGMARPGEQVYRVQEPE
jgi:cell division protein FtsB